MAGEPGKKAAKISGMDRRAHLEAYLTEHPDDAFARYGLALERAKAGEPEAALAEFGRLLERHPGYAAGYQQAGQLLLRLERAAEARAMLQAGVAAAQQAGNAHAAAEMSSLLEEIPG